MNHKNNLIFLLSIIATTSCQRFYDSKSSSKPMALTGTKGLRVSATDPVSKSNRISLTPFFPKRDNKMLTDKVYFKAIGFKKEKMFYDENFYEYTPSSQPNSASFYPVKPHAGFSGYAFFDGITYTFWPNGHSWSLGNTELVTGKGVVNIETGVIDLRAPTIDMALEFFAPTGTIRKEPFSEGYGIVNAQKINTKSHFIHKEINGDIIIIANIDMIDAFILRDIIGLPVYSSDHHKILGFIETYHKNETGEMNIRILSIHSSRLRKTLSGWELIPKTNVNEQISSSWKAKYCSKSFVEQAIKDRMIQNKNPERCQPKNPTPSKANPPTAPWDQVQGSGWCDAASVIAAIEKAIQADQTALKAAACCGTAIKSQPVWITDKLEEDRIRAQYCDPKTVQDAIAKAIAADQACKQK